MVMNPVRSLFTSARWRHPDIPNFRKSTERKQAFSLYMLDIRLRKITTARLGKAALNTVFSYIISRVGAQYTPKHITHERYHTYVDTRIGSCLNLPILLYNVKCTAAQYPSDKARYIIQVSDKQLHTALRPKILL